MAYDIPTTEPTSFTAGDSWKWDRTFGDFPAGDGWQLSYAFRGETDLAVAWSSEVTANGDSFEIRIPKASTGLTPGPYELYGYVDDGTDRHIVTRMNVTVQKDPATAVGAKSLAKTMLDAIDARLQSRVLTAEQRRVQINGREIEYASHAELIQERDRWAIRYELERNPNRRLSHAARFVG